MMNRLQICPYDGKEINFNNLAYEIVCSNGWDWERIKKETVIGEEKKLYISENDRRRALSDSKHAGTSCVMLLENGVSNGKNGLQLLCEHIEGGKSDVRKDNASGSKYMDFLSASLSNYRLDSGFLPSMTSEKKFEIIDDTAPVKLHYIKNHGKYYLDNANQKHVMQLIPCCPHCHRRLPDRWEEAEDYIIISIIGEEMEACGLGTQLTETDQIEIYPADENGTCFEGEYPIFMNVCCRDKKQEHLMTIGFYNSSVNQASVMQKLTDHMYADICYFNLEKADIFTGSKYLIKHNVLFKPCQLPSIEEQGEFQRLHKGEIISAKSLLQQMTMGYDASPQNHDIVTEYENMIETRKNNHIYGQMQKMHLLGVVTKSDLMKAKGQSKIADRYHPLFEQRTNQELKDVNLMMAKNNLIRDMVAEYQILGERYPEEMEFAYGNDIDWFCMDIESEQDKKFNAPVMTCINRRFAENGWI